MQRSLILTPIMVVAVAGLATTGLVAVSGSAAAQEEVDGDQGYVVLTNDVGQDVFAGAFSVFTIATDGYEAGQELTISRHGYWGEDISAQAFRGYPSD